MIKMIKKRYLVAVFLAFSSLFLAIVFHRQPSQVKANDEIPIVIDSKIPKAVLPCLREKLSAEYFGEEKDGSTDYYLVRHSLGTGNQKIHAGTSLYSVRSGACNYENPPDENGVIALATVVPFDIAVSLSKQSYTRIIEEVGGRDVFAKQLSTNVPASVEKEHAVALTQLGFTVPSNWDVLEPGERADPNKYPEIDYE